ncbi:ankyrin repeat-containing domain protein [Pelagophyceae sp. CCMP2097]|nr:ankyrin repeat-containing domain protein [Pelagophyceae sp. CCMP2097]
MAADPFYAVRTGNVELVRRLVAAGAVTVETTRWSGVTLLHRAAGEGRTEVAEYLLDVGAAIDAETFFSRETPLHLACANGHEETAAMLRTRGKEARPNAKRLPLGVPPLQRCRLWRPLGAQWTVKDRAGRTPVQRCFASGLAGVAHRLDLHHFRCENQERVANEAANRIARERDAHPAPA